MALRGRCAFESSDGKPWVAQPPASSDEQLHAVSLGDLSCRQKILAEATTGPAGEQPCLRGPEPSCSPGLGFGGREGNSRQSEGALRLDPEILSSGVPHPCWVAVASHNPSLAFKAT